MSGLKVQVGDVQSACSYAETTLKDIKLYYGHLELDMAVDPMLIILNGKFDLLNGKETPEEYKRWQTELVSSAKECEKLILLLMGEKSEKLAEIYCLYSFFELQNGQLQKGALMQKKATKIVEDCYGQLSQAYLNRLHE